MRCLPSFFFYQKCNKTVPFGPKGGEVYAFRPDNQSDATYENLVTGAVRLYDNGLALGVYALFPQRVQSALNL